jgi:LacI family transcriptional regulator
MAGQGQSDGAWSFMDRPPSIRAIARAAGVSPTTVRHLLSRGQDAGSNRRGTLGYHPKTVERILAVAKSMGWIATPAAPQRRALALVQPRDIYWSMSIYADLPSRLLTTTARSAQWDILLLRVDDDEDALDDYGGRIAGWLLMDPLFFQFEQRPEAFPQPRLLVNWREEPAGEMIVNPDDAGSARLLLRHLVQLGHRRIAWLSIPKAYDEHRLSLVLRLDAVRGECREAGLMLGEFAAVAPLIEAIRDDGPTAVICYGGVDALDLQRACGEQGWQIPRDVSLVSCDDFSSLQSNHGITAVEVFTDDYLAQMIQCLEQQIADPAMPRRCHRIPGRLRVRGSSAPPRE